MEITFDIALIAGLGIMVYMIMQLIKTVVDIAMGVKKRKANVWLTRVVLPAIPPIIGCLLGVSVPLRPGALIEFVHENLAGFDQTMAYAAYGTIVGQFSDYIYSKAKAFMVDLKAEKT